MAIDEVDVITYGSASEPTLTTPVDANYGAHAYTVEYWDGANWQNVATVSGNAFVWRQFSLSPTVNASTVRVTVTAAGSADNSPRIIGLEAWGDTAIFTKVLGAVGVG